MIAQIHYGGGSPTSIPVERLRELNEHMRERFLTIQDPEIAIECHPGYLDESYWEALTQAGFNRISLGVQDFDEKVLKTVNRRASLLPMETIFGSSGMPEYGLTWTLSTVYPIRLFKVSARLFAEQSNFNQTVLLRSPMPMFPG
jgi:coproporphyrinogen III oxidase, anaerobic (EC 1.3.99.22)